MTCVFAPASTIGRPGIQSARLLREALERIAEIDHAQFHRIGDVDFLPKLTIREELLANLLGESVRLQLLDDVVVVDAAVGEFRIVRQRG
jgi:hypothetical protein